MNTIVAPASSQLFTNEVNCNLTVSDAVWIGTALLHFHTDQSMDQPFPCEQIVAMVQSANLTHGVEKSIYLHVNQHCVANRPPNSNRSRMLFETGRGERRLFRTGDRYDPAREGSPSHPDWEKLPSKYQFLHRWYEDVWNGKASATAHDPLLAMAGLGTGMWDGLDADAYVASLRAGWEGRP